MTRKPDDPAVTPYRAPVHQVAFAVRDGRALLGIAHAGELLAAMRLSADELVALVARMTAALPALGVDAETLAGALAGIEAPARALVPTVRLTCADCGEGFGAPAYGRPPLRCPVCRAAREHAMTLAKNRRYKARKREAVG